MPIRMLGEKYYLVEDLEDILPVSKQTIQIHIRTGKLPGKRVGRFYYVSQASLKEYLRGRGPNEVKAEDKQKI